MKIREREIKSPSRIFIDKDIYHADFLSIKRSLWTNARNLGFYCERCYAKLKSRSIHQYNYKPEPIFYGSGSLFMGIELEIDGGGENHDNAQNILDIANCDGTRIYCKHDGSLHHGFEIVSNPMTLD